MSATLLPADRIEHVTGFGMTSGADGYVYRPSSVEQVAQVLELARKSGRKVVQRGSGRSYGDANILPESITLDVTRLNRILAWDPATGVIDCEGGVTVEDLWRHTLEDGYWPPVVSGTMYPTLAGALAMNIHGKNNFCYGTLGEHVLELDVMDSKGKVHTLTPKDELFFAVISGLGLLGCITRVRLQLKKVPSGDVKVYARSIVNLEHQFATFREFENQADYMVSWVDCFPGKNALGRGQFHAAWYADGNSSSLRPNHQDLPDTILGLIPKSVMWRFLKPLNNRFGMRNINAAKHYASALLGNGKTAHQSLVGFSFLLDYVPNWRKAYLPGGFIQYQSFVPKEHAETVYRTQIEWQQAAMLESFLGVMKRHRPDKFLFSHATDGYSFALDFKVTENNRDQLVRLAHKMNELVLAAGGKFYFAKDSTLRPSDVQAYLGENALKVFERFRKKMDPDQLFSNSLALRVGLLEPK